MQSKLETWEVAYNGRASVGPRTTLDKAVERAAALTRRDGGIYIVRRAEVQP